MYYSSLESSHRGGSNGSKIMFLAQIDGELRLLERTRDISPSSGRRMLKHSSLESSHRGGSNGSKITLLPLLDRGLSVSK